MAVADAAVVWTAVGSVAAVAGVAVPLVHRRRETARHRDAEPLEQARAVTAWIDLVPDEDKRTSDPDKLHLVTARSSIAVLS